MMNVLAYADGQRDLVSLADRIGVPAETCLPIIARLLEARFLERIDQEGIRAQEFPDA
jgi:DNA-binding Lrp family transcriptional regulator